MCSPTSFATLLPFSLKEISLAVTILCKPEMVDVRSGNEDCNDLGRAAV